MRGFELEARQCRVEPHRLSRTAAPGSACRVRRSGAVTLGIDLSDYFIVGRPQTVFVQVHSFVPGRFDCGVSGVETGGGLRVPASRRADACG
jgi:hypothetical protein